MKASILLFVLRVSDGGTAGFADPLYAQCTEAPPAVQLQADAGTEADWLVPHARMQRTACLMATCESEREAKARQLTEKPPPPSWLAWGAGLALASLLGFFLGTAFNLFGR